MAMAGMCGVCGSMDMRGADDGFSYCNQCGSQSQFFLDEAMDDDMGLFNSRFRREKKVTRNAALNSQQQTQTDDVLASQQASLIATQEDFTFLQQASQFGSTFGSQLELSQFGTFSQTPGVGVSQARMKEDPGDEFGEPGASDSDKMAAKVRKVYVEGMQMLVQMQCEALVQRWGINPLICGILGPVWMKFLRSTCVFDKGWADEALAVAELQHRKVKNEDDVLPSGSDSPPPSEDELDKDGNPAVRKTTNIRKRKKKCSVEPMTSYGEKGRLIWLRNLKARIPIRASLAVVYLVCHLAREPLLPTDLVNWALEGTLPYLRAHLDIEKRANWDSKMLLLKLRTMFKPLRMTNARIVEYLACMIANRLSLQLPPVNYHAIARRLLKDLGLPEAKFAPYVCRIYEWYPCSGLWLSTQVASLPTRVYVMAMLIEVFRTVYKLDGRRKKVTKNAVDVEEVLRLKDEETGWDVEDFVAKMKLVLHKESHQFDDKEELMAYLKYCREVIFSGHNMSREEETLSEYFWKLYEESFRQDTAGNKKATSGETLDEDAATRRMRELSLSKHVEDKGLKDTVALAEDKPDNNSIRRKKLKMKGGSAEKSRDPLLRGMESLGFVLLDPVQEVLGDDKYFQFLVSKAQMRYVHEDYYIVLLACSKIIDVDPRSLHLGVLNLERGLRKTEKNIQDFLACRETVTVDEAPREIDDGGPTETEDKGPTETEDKGPTETEDKGPSESEDDGTE